MIQTKRALAIALFIPILTLVVLTCYKKSVLSTGKEVTLPISGYDPRDLLSGHYLIYQIDYGVTEICPKKPDKQRAYICLEPKVFSYSPPDSCAIFIEGNCSHGRFEAGIEKYFIPEEKAKDLENQVRSKSASILLSVTSNGNAQVKDLLIDGQSWKKQ